MWKWDGGQDCDVKVSWSSQYCNGDGVVVTGLLRESGLVVTVLQ